MQAVVGVIPRQQDAQRVVDALGRIGVPDRDVSVLAPPAPEGSVRAVPTTDAEPPGIGGTLGGVVGGATGTASGLAFASLALPGVGPVMAAGAIILGLVGVMTGGAIGAKLDESLSKGLPTDELYVYRDALRKGRSVVVVTTDDEAEAARVREVFRSCGAESVDAARDEWWIGLRDAEEAAYTRQGGDFRKDEALYRQGFDAAARLGEAAAPYDVARAQLRERFGSPAEEPAFRAGYERGRAWRLDGV
jgi:hypothetical protein